MIRLDRFLENGENSVWQSIIWVCLLAAQQHQFTGNGYQTVGGNEKILDPPREIQNKPIEDLPLRRQNCSHHPQMVVFGDEVR